jgi:CBS domain-containing protein
MAMLVAQILIQKGAQVFTCTADETLTSASALLFARGVGAMVVMEGDKVAGILSERDVVRAIAQGGAEALYQPVRRFMTSDVIFARTKETVDELMSRMTDRRIRHLPVCEDGKLVGIVSIGDMVKSKISDATHEAETLKAYIAAG